MACFKVKAANLDVGCGGGVPKDSKEAYLALLTLVHSNKSRN